MKRIMLTAAAFATSSTILADVPEVSNVTMSQDDTRLVTIQYTLDKTNAVVTLDVQTNDTANGTWASIGGEAVRNAQGDVWKQVAVGQHSITWRPDLSWPDHKIADGGARAVVTSWSLDNTPDYMVVDLTTTGGDGTQKYYPAAEFLPGGLLGNDDYRMTKLVMRKIMAQGVEWTMGSTGAETQRDKNKETPHLVTLTNNYYIGVFPVTQAQWWLVCEYFPSHFTNPEYRAMRPVEMVSFNEIRNNDGSKVATGKDVAEGERYEWPAAPNDVSFLGKLRTKTGLDFDLPSEAQWEFAARAGNGDTKWGDGSSILNANPDENLNRLGCYNANSGKQTAVVGSYAPNDWGLYDVHGNVYEWCLDWYVEDITKFGGAVNTAPGAIRVIRGGCWFNAVGDCRPAFRSNFAPSTRYYSVGLRVLCTAGLR